MAYVKNTWVDQKVQRPKTYNFTNNDDGSTTLIDAFGNVEELGTPVNADNMNHIEDGLANVGLWIYSPTVEYNKDDAVLTVNNDKIVLYKSKQDNNKGNALTNINYWEEVKLGGSSSLEVCDIGTALYIDETKGLRRRLNGQIVDANANTQGFIDKLVKIKALAPSLFDTEENWQSIKSASKLGQCGKFVFNYSGVEIVSVRIPAVVNINGLVDMAKAGLIKDESLPDPNSELYSFWGSGNGTNGNQSLIAQNYSGSAQSTPSSGNTYIKVNNSTYQDNAPVQQEAIQYPYFIQIATGVETEVNIKNTLELNNPFTFGMNMYFKGEMDNVSWLKSAGQQNAKADYPDFYDWVLTNANAGKDGFKLSTASDITDYDFVVNTTNETFRLPLKNGQEGVFASGVKGNSLTLGITDGTTFYGLQVGSEDARNVSPRKDSYGLPVGSPYNTGSNIEKTIGLTTDSTKSGIVVDITVPTGYNLYYYVGVTVQNEGLINAGRFAEKLVNCLDKTSTSDKALSVTWSAPDFSTKTAKNNNTEYTAEYTGWLEVKTDDYNSATYLTINGDRKNINGASDNQLNNSYHWMLLPKGTTYKIEYGRIYSAETNYMNFYKCIGEV